jgi:3-methylcrotonyl-CoA carboxylase alpha subunit
MGSKSAAKALIEKAGVPLVPGYHGDEQTAERFIEEANKTGFPLLIKASAGGGGKGMRVVRGADELTDAIAAAKREAESSFGDAHLLMERYLETPRHVEVQVLFDQHGNGRYLFDRDCSVQRRHQKIIEEAPAPGLTPDSRRAMGEAAVRCGEAIGYVGAGTVEFLYEPGGHFYFMEMNTRLQVEHPVTEMITGLDLVDWQLRIAEGAALPWAQDALQSHGHAMEARVYAEDPDNDFLPVTGTLHYLHEPSGMPHVRVDSGVCSGQMISPWYDPMLAKVIAWGEDREQARQRLESALSEYRALGVTLNTDYVCRILQHPDFAAAQLTTHFIENHAEDLSHRPFTHNEQLALSWLGWHLATQQPVNDSPWSHRDSFRVAGPRRQQCEIRLADEDQILGYRLDGNGRAQIDLSGETHPLTLRWSRGRDGHSTVVRLANRSVTLGWAAHGERLGLFADASHWEALVNHPEEQVAAASDDGKLKAPMHGRVTAVNCSEGDRVDAGTPLIVMEAMKMEHTLKSPGAGRVAALHCAREDSVISGQVLVELDLEGQSE